MFASKIKTMNILLVYTTITSFALILTGSVSLERKKEKKKTWKHTHKQTEIDTLLIWDIGSSFVENIHG